MKKPNLKLSKINQMHPDLIGVNTNLNIMPYGDSASRLYMEGNMVPKSVVVSGNSERLITTGFEKQYGDTARSIRCPSDMTVEEVFYVQSTRGDGILTDGWKEIFVIFKNEDKNYFDILVLPRFHTQNTYVGFEYVYDKEMMRRLKKDAPFSKGEEFARSPRVRSSGEWNFATETIVCAMSSHATEEDGIRITDRYAREKLRCMFKHERGFEYNETDWIPLNLYGTEDNPRPFARPGETIREDGIVMGFRRRAGCNPLISLTKKGLMQPDYLFDKLFYAPPSSVMMDVIVEGEKIKDRSHNRSTEQIPQQHSEAMREFEAMQNAFYVEVINWYERLIVRMGGQEPEISFELDRFVRDAYGKHTKRNGIINNLGYSYKNIRQKDWKITIRLKEEVSGRVKFKMAGTNGDKGVAVDMIPWQDAPHYEDGTYADIIINNTPAFRRQIMTMLAEATINFINLQVHKEVIALRNEGKYKEAYDRVFMFYETGFPEFAEIVKNVMVTEEDRNEHVDYICKHNISVHLRSDAKVYGINIIRELRKVFKHKPQKVKFRDAFGEMVESHYPILLTSMYYMLLDKFGADDSSQSFPKANPFGLPASNSQGDKHTNWYIDKGSRNIGESETRWETAHNGTKENIKQLALANSDIVRTNAIKRIIRADDPFEIDCIVTDEEIATNRAVIMGSELLSDSGYILRAEKPEDRDNEL
jgi:RNA polymerase Rpb2, domain 6.